MLNATDVKNSSSVIFSRPRGVSHAPATRAGKTHVHAMLVTRKMDSTWRASVISALSLCAGPQTAATAHQQQRRHRRRGQRVRRGAGLVALEGEEDNGDSDEEDEEARHQWAAAAGKAGGCERRQPVLCRVD